MATRKQSSSKKSIAKKPANRSKSAKAGWATRRSNVAKA